MRTIIVLALAGLASLTGWSQTAGNASDSNPASLPTAERGSRNFYRLNFLIKEIDNERLVNSRAYSILISSGKGRGAIRAGEKVPFSSSSGAKTEWQQIDVGVSIDLYNLEQDGDRVAFTLSAEVSSVPDAHGDTSPPPSVPVIRSNRWESSVLLPLDKPVVLFSSDDPASKRTMQLQLTATLIR